MSAWASGAWANQAWYGTAWYTETPAESTPSPVGGWSPALRIKPKKRHRKLETFRHELERLVAKLESHVIAESQPEIVDLATQQAEAIVERFNIVQTFDDSGVISNQMELLRQDISDLWNIVSRIDADNKRAKQIQAEIEEQNMVIFIMASDL